MLEEELKTLQRVALDILVEFDLFCKRNGLQYYLIGGALLGAARYGDFIPWDDDIDIAMPRKDYEQLQEIWKNESAGQYFLQSGKNDPKFSRCILKLRLNNTRIVEYSSQGIDMHEGIYIDIFPIDYVSIEPGKRLALRAFLIRKLMSARAIKNGYKTGKFVIAKRLIMCLMVVIGNDAIDNAIYRLCTYDNQKKCKYAILYLHNYPWERQIHPIEIFGEGCPCEFAGRQFVAPTDTNNFLTTVFGSDYMQEPPKEKQTPPHKYILIQFHAGNIP